MRDETSKQQQAEEAAKKELAPEKTDLLKSISEEQSPFSVQQKISKSFPDKDGGN